MPGTIEKLDDLYTKEIADSREHRYGIALGYVNTRHRVGNLTTLSEEDVKVVTKFATDLDDMLLEDGNARVRDSLWLRAKIAEYGVQNRAEFKTALEQETPTEDSSDEAKEHYQERLDLLKRIGYLE